MPSWPRAEPTNGARPCRTSMCIRSSSAFVAHMARWSRRYSSRVASPSSIARTVAPDRDGDLGHLVSGHAHALQVVVVRALELGEVRPLGPLLAKLLDLLHDARDER